MISLPALGKMARDTTARHTTALDKTDMRWRSPRPDVRHNSAQVGFGCHNHTRGSRASPRLPRRPAAGPRNLAVEHSPEACGCKPVVREARAGLHYFRVPFRVRLQAPGSRVRNRCCRAAPLQICRQAADTTRRDHTSFLAACSPASRDSRRRPLPGQTRAGRRAGSPNRPPWCSASCSPSD